MSRRDEEIVITGAGLNCCLGLDRHEAWQAVVEGRGGIGPLTALEQPSKSRDGGQSLALPDSDEHDQSREVRYLQLALKQALNEAGLSAERWPEPQRIGIILGTTLAGMRAGGMFLRNDDPASLRSFLAGSTLEKAIQGLPIGGLSITTCAACASGLSAIAMGMTLLRRGELDVVIAGGYDPVSEYVYAGFNSLRLITDGPPLPFSQHRQGMKLGEGTGIVILERADHARSRGAQPLARVLGFGESSDAHHLTKPHPEGTGAAQAIRAALADAGVSAAAIDMIAAHATATPNNDAAEFAAYSNVFADGLSQIPVTAFKSHLGHTLGAAGAIELILSMMSMQSDVVPPLANVTREDVEFAGLDVVTNVKRPASIQHTLNLSLGFGGANACVVLGREGSQSDASMSLPAAMDAQAASTVCITGVGVILPGCIGNDAFLERLSEPAADATTISGDIDEQQLTALFANARRVRRFSSFVKMMLATTNVAIRHARLDASDDPSLIAQASAILGSTFGTVSFTEEYYRQVVDEGIDAANPMLFAEGVPNVASAQLSLLLNLQGGSQTIIGTRTAGLDALHMACQRIASGRCSRMIVGAGEEYAGLVERAYRSCGLYSNDAGQTQEAGFVAGAGAVILVLESDDAALARGASVLGVLESSTQVRGRNDAKPAAALVEALEIALKSIGDPGCVFTSANNTWLDRVERAVLERCLPQSKTMSLYGRIPEVFSAFPLAGVAAAVLHRDENHLVGILGSDYCGSVSAVKLRLE